MTKARDLRSADRRTLRDHIVRGYPVDPHQIEGWVYRGTSLGLPKLVERLTWKTFQKTFYRDPATQRLVGWNVRLEQDGVDAPSREKRRDGRPVTEWHYEVIPPAGVATPRGFDRGLIIDYGLGYKPPLNMRWTKDPLVALEPGNTDELLGVSYMVVAGQCVETPTYFTLERDHPIDDIPYDDLRVPRAAWTALLTLTAPERAWVEALLAAVIATGGTDGLPAFLATDRAAFWHAFEESAAPLVRAGLRPMAYTLTFLPMVSGFGKPFFQLATGERERFLADVAHDRRYFVRQSLTTLKMLACFAYFDDPVVRDRFRSVDPVDGVGATNGAP